MGTSICSSGRLSCIDWAGRNNAWIIEDDYDSEFQFAHRPHPSLQGLALNMADAFSNVIYVGTFSKTMLPSLRIGYLVVPEHLVDQCLMLKALITGDTPAFQELALAEFIENGDYLRHIRKMRNLYKSKHDFFISCLKASLGSNHVLMSQPAGMHITFGWLKGRSAIEVKNKLAAVDITVRTLDEFLLHNHAHFFDYEKTLIAGFGNSSLEQIERGVKQISAYIQ